MGLPKGERSKPNQSTKTEVGPGLRFKQDVSGSSKKASPFNYSLLLLEIRLKGFGSDLGTPSTCLWVGQAYPYSLHVDGFPAGEPELLLLDSPVLLFRGPSRYEVTRL